MCIFCEEKTLQGKGINLNFWVQKNMNHFDNKMYDQKHQWNSLIKSVIKRTIDCYHTSLKVLQHDFCKLEPPKLSKFVHDLFFQVGKLFLQKLEKWHWANVKTASFWLCLLGVTGKSERAGHNSVALPTAAGRREGDRICPALTDFPVTPRRHNQSSLHTYSSMYFRTFLHPAHKFSYNKP